MKYYEILPTHTETPRNATLKIANLYIEFNDHFLTLQKKIPLLLNRSVHTDTVVTTTSLNSDSGNPVQLTHVNTLKPRNFPDDMFKVIFV